MTTAESNDAPRKRARPFRVIKRSWQGLDSLDETITWGFVVGLEGAILLAYFALTTASVNQYRYLVYPFVWINLALWAAVRVRPSPTSRRRAGVALVIAGSYLAVLLTLSGVIVFMPWGGPADGLAISWLAPGWGPLLTYSGTILSLYLVPFKVIGYMLLSYLLYVNVLVMSRSALSGTVGFASCVGCLTPVLAPVMGGFAGVSSTSFATTYRWSYEIGTALFVSTVGLLYWAQRS